MHTRKTAILKNPRLRLLMKAVGFERRSQALDEELGSVWVMPPRHSAQDIREYKDAIEKAEFSPPSFEDGGAAEDQVRRKAAPRKKVAYDDDEDDGNDFLDDDGALFPGNLPFEKPDGASKGSKKRRVRRKKDATGSEGDELSSSEEDARRTERADKRRERELEKQRKIKSALYVSPSDDEDDPEADAAFFAREEALRQRLQKALQFAPTDVSQLQESAAQPAAIAEAVKRLLAERDDVGELSDVESVASKGSTSRAKSRKRKSDALLADDDEEEQDGASTPPPAKKAAPVPKKKTRLGFLVDSSDEEDEGMNDADPSSPPPGTDEEGDADGDAGGDSDEEMDTNDTPLSSNPKAASKGQDGTDVVERSPLREKFGNTIAVQDEPDDEDDDMPVATKRRPRMKAGFLDDSDDE